MAISLRHGFATPLISQGLKTRRRNRQMSLSEIMTILVAFHRSYYRNFKRYYLDHVCIYYKTLQRWHCR